MVEAGHRKVTPTAMRVASQRLMESTNICKLSAVGSRCVAAHTFNEIGHHRRRGGENQPLGASVKFVEFARPAVSLP